MYSMWSFILTVGHMFYVGACEHEAAHLNCLRAKETKPRFMYPYSSFLGLGRAVGWAVHICTMQQFFLLIFHYCKSTLGCFSYVFFLSFSINE